MAPSTGSFAVNASGTPDTLINISTGVAVITGTPTSQNSQKFRVKCTVTGTATISANASGSTKYDWVYIKLDATNLNAPNTAGDNVATIVTSRSSSASSDDGTPPTYGINIAVVTVANGFSTITNANIRDTRTQSVITATSTGTSQDWYSTGYQPSTVTCNGNRSYDLLFSSVDLTSFISNGMRLRTTRTVPSPNQCTSLNGTTQYYSKSSPAGMTFTDDFTVSAWIKISSYVAAGQTVVSRYNGTSGWQFNVNSSGQVAMAGFNAGAANYSQIVSYQSIPLNKWVHIAGELDMSSFTNTSTTSYIMIDGVDAPAAVSRAGTNPTALIQAGNLEIGSNNAGTNPLTGKVAQIAIYNAKVTQANIRATISQTLAGTETSLISAYSFNNTINDLNANANNLTANGSAVATNADSPFGGQADGTISSTLNYAIVQKTAFSTNTTLTVQVPEGCAIATTGGVSAVSYSTVKSPFGMPVSADKWEVQYILKTQNNTGAIAANTIINLLSAQLNVPVGSWDLGFDFGGQITHAGASFLAQQLALSTSASSVSDKELATQSIAVSASLTEVDGRLSRRKLVSITTATPYYILTQSSTATTTQYLNGQDSFGACIINARSTYL